MSAELKGLVVPAELRHKQFLNAQDVAACMGVSVSTGYRVIQMINKELKAQGCVTVAGRVSALSFWSKTTRNMASEIAEGTKSN